MNKKKNSFSKSYFILQHGKPGKEHWAGVKWILRYLKGTKDIGIIYRNVSIDVEPLKEFTDSDYAVNLAKKGCLFVHTIWQHNKLEVQTTEVEYIACTEVVKEEMWIRELIKKLGIQQKVMSVFCDNQISICLSKYPMFHEIIKHIDMRFHFITEKIQKVMVKIVKVSKKNNPTDMLTALDLSKFRIYFDLLRVVVMQRYFNSGAIVSMFTS